MKPFRKWPIVRTFLGKNSEGKKLNKVLPFRKQREFIGAAIRGIADVSPVPNAKDASVREKLEKIYAITRKLQLDTVQGKAVEAIGQIHDLVDDGQLNDSAELSPETRKKVRLISSFLFFGLLGYEAVAVFVGSPSVINFAVAFFGDN